MKVCVVCGDIPLGENRCRGGGGGEVVIQLSTALVRQGIEVDLITASNEPRHERVRDFNGVRVHYSRHLREPFFTFTETIVLRKLLEKENFDIIHGHGQELFMPSILKKIGLLRSIPMVLTYHGSAIPGPPLRRYPWDSLSWRFSYHAMRYSDLITVPSRWAQDKLKSIKSLSKKRIDVIHNGVDERYFKPKTKTQGLEISKDDEKEGRFKTIIFVGNLLVSKGIETLVKSLKEVVGKYPNTRMLVIGDGRDKYYLRDIALSEGILDHMIFKGRVSREDVLGYYMESDLMFFPSENENLPMVVLEAMACGLPVVTSNVGGISEEVVDGKTGFIIDSNDVEGFSEAIVTLLDNPKLLEDMGRAGRDRILNYFTWDKIAKEYVEQYDKLIHWEKDIKVKNDYGKHCYSYS